MYTHISHCRACGSNNLAEVLHFGPQYLSSLFVEDNESEPLSKVKVPLTLLMCRSCMSVQLKETVNPDLMYTRYFYRSFTNDLMRRDLQDVVNCAEKQVSLSADDFIIDIGANDMTMLSMFKTGKRIGVDPAKNIDWSNVDKLIKIVNDYFTKESIERECGKIKAKIITSCACFYDFPDPNTAIRNIKELLAEDGVCVVQVSHLLATIRDFNYYDICSEHLFYYSLQVLNYLFGSNGLSIYDVETNFVNGGSLRIYAKHTKSGMTKSDKFYQVLGEEVKYGLALEKTYLEFEKKILESSKKIYDYIKGSKKLILGLGASTKANVLLQVCGITKEMIPAFSERSPVKIGKRILGLDIPMISEEDARRMKPDMYFCPIWNFEEEVKKRESVFLENGGEILFAMPYPRVVNKCGEVKL